MQMTQYGNYVRIKPGDDIAEVKRLLREQIHSTIDELCDRDDFWIIKSGGITSTCGWVIAVPCKYEEGV